MDLKTIFKRFVLLDFSIFVLAFIAFFFISPEITRLEEDLNSNFSDTYFMGMGVIAIIYIIAYLINLFLLYKFKSIGKQIYLILFIVLLVLSLLSPPNAVDSWLYVLDGLGMANSGAILVLLYFSPIKKEFEK